MASKLHSTLQAAQRVSRAAMRCWSIRDRRSVCAREQQRLGRLTGHDPRTDADGQDSSQRGLGYALHQQAHMQHGAKHHDLTPLAKSCELRSVAAIQASYITPAAKPAKGQGDEREP